MKPVKTKMVVGLIGLAVALIVYFQDPLLDELRWSQIRNGDERESLARYVDRFAQGRHIQEAQAMIDKIDAWSAVRNSQNLAEVERYIKTYPDDAHTPAARKQAEKLRYRQTVESMRTAQALYSFTQANPPPTPQDQEQITQIMDALIQNEVAALSSLKELNAYVADNPVIKNYAELEKNFRRILAARDADRQAWAEAVAENTDDSYTKYRFAFPHGEFVGEVYDRIDELRWQELTSPYYTDPGLVGRGGTLMNTKQAKTPEQILTDYRFYVRSYFNGKYVQQARQAVDELSWPFVTAENTVTAYQGYLEESPDGRHVAEARRRVESLRQDASLYRTDMTTEALIHFFAKYPGHSRTDEAVQAIVPGLVEWRHRKQVAQILEDNGWRPQTDWERVYFALATKDKKFMETNRDLARTVFLNSVDSPRTEKEKYAGLYALIALGADEAVPQLKQILAEKGSKGLCEAYLNSGYEELITAAEKWARDRGYPITKSYNANAPARWGSLR